MRYLALATLLVAACSPASDDAVSTAPQMATFTASEFGFSGPDSLAPGMTMLHLVNGGEQPHHMMVAQLGEGKTAQNVVEDFTTNPNAVPGYLVWRGGASGVGPGDSTGGVTDLPEGRYVAICFVPDPSDGAPHFMKGMTKEFVVSGPRHAGEPLVADAEIRLSEFAFAATGLTAGTHTFAIVNDGQQVHEVQLVRINEGATAESFMEAMAPGATTPPPGKEVGGAGAISPGLTNYFTVNLTPGNYIMLCFVPDTDGTPHAMKGMVQSFTVAGE